MKKTKFFLAMFFLLLLTVTSGCTASQNTESYTAEFPYDPQQYMLFLNKEVQGVTNHLTTCIMAISKSADGDYPPKQALTNIQNCLALVWETQEAVNSMRPPATYADTRNAILETIQDTETNCLACLKELQEDNPDVDRLQELAGLLQGDFIALTSSVNAYWK